MTSTDRSAPQATLAVLVLGEPADGPALLAALAPGLRPGDRLILCPDRAATAFRLRLAAEEIAWPEPDTFACPDPPRRGGLRAGPALPCPPPRISALASARALITAGPRPDGIVALPATLAPDAARSRLDAMRLARPPSPGSDAARSASGARLRFDGVLPPPFLDTVILAGDAFEGPDESPSHGLLVDPEPALAARAGERIVDLAGAGPAPPPAGPATARALTGHADAAALFATALPGARDAARPILAAKGLDLPETDPVSPPISGRAKLRLHLAGGHAHRSPFAYPALAPLWQDMAGTVADPAGADCVIWSHPLDLWEMDRGFGHAAWGRPQALVSEEPFWDSLFSPDPLAPAVTLGAAQWGKVRVHQLNHHTSSIFAFHRLPYLLLAEPALHAALSVRFAANAGVTAEEWRLRHGQAPVRLAFMAERREEAFHDVTFPEGDMTGLCAWRTRVALAARRLRWPLAWLRPVETLGASWQGGPTRFDLEDWHGDKLARLAGRAVTLSALENTHQPAYLSEKIFDAFACGARPLYAASPAHRLHRLGLPGESWLNVHGLDPGAAARIALARPDRAFYGPYAAAQATLAALFSDREALARERDRLGRALRAELAMLAGAGAAR